MTKKKKSRSTDRGIPRRLRTRRAVAPTMGDLKSAVVTARDPYADLETVFEEDSTRGLGDGGRHVHTTPSGSTRTPVPRP